MKYSLPQVRVSPRFSSWLFRFAVLVALAAAPVMLVMAPSRAAAEQPAPAPNSAPAAAPAQSSGSATAVAPKSAEAPESEEEQEQAFLHSSNVQWVARILHLNVETTIDILLGINFAIVALSVGFLVFRTLPKMIPSLTPRWRKEKLRADLKVARDATADAQARLSAVEAKLAGLGEEMQKFRAQVEQESLEDEKRIKAALGEESARIVAAAEQEIGVAAAQAKRGLRNFAADLAIEQATKQLALTPEADRAVIAEFVAGVAGDGSGKGEKN